MQIIPAIDLLEGKVVRLLKGDFKQVTVYSNDPLEMAIRFEGAGLQRLHVVDLNGAKEGTPKHLKILEKIASKTHLLVDYGGGLRQTNDLRDALNAGTNWLTIGSVAAKEPALFIDWVTTFLPQKFMVGADVREEKIAINGWLEQTEINLFIFLQQLLDLGIRQIFVTDIAKDGALIGPALDLYKKIITQCPDIQLIASGGIVSKDDFLELKEIGCTGAIVGKAYYEGKIKIEDLKIE
jgi:phosphoribosylformimino-5-aminoimidazole carboxamide ribotide isomerase